MNDAPSFFTNRLHHIGAENQSEHEIEGKGSKTCPERLMSGCEWNDDFKERIADILVKHKNQPMHQTEEHAEPSGPLMNQIELSSASAFRPRFSLKQSGEYRREEQHIRG
ncbi:hypothetical protein D3C71_1482150 [compost metagenome]